MGAAEAKQAILDNRTALGIEFGSTRIKAVLVDGNNAPIASGGHEWENRYENGVWTYSLEDIWKGLKDCYADLAVDVKKQYGLTLKKVGAMGVSAMMHGYMAFDADGKLLVPFRTWRNTMTAEAARRLTDLFNYNIPQRWSIAHLYQAVITGEELPELGTILSILEVGVVFYLLEAVFALVVPRFLPGTQGQKGVWRYALAFPNVGFIGYPVAVALFGDGALFYAAILALPFNLLSYSLGPLLLAGAARFRWKQLFTPCIVASVLGLVLALTRLRPPALVGEMLDFVGDITVPLSLLVVGSLLAGMSAGQVLRSPKLWLLTAIRLLLLPVALCLVLRALGIDSLVLGIAVTQMAMPVAVNGTLLSMEYGGDTECMAQITFLTTAASIVTIPIVAVLLL